MPSMETDDVHDGSVAGRGRVGGVLVLVGLGWIGLGFALRSGVVDLVGLFARSSVLGLYPGEAARMFETDLVGVLTAVVGASVIGTTANGPASDDAGRGPAPIRFSTALGSAGLGFVVVVAALPLGPPPGGPIAGPPVVERLVDVRFLLSYVAAWSFPLGVAANRRERAVVGAGIATLPLAAVAFTVLLVVSGGGLAVLAGVFAVGVAVSLVAVGSVVGLPLYLAGRVLGPHGTPDRIVGRFLRNTR